MAYVLPYVLQPQSDLFAYTLVRQLRSQLLESNQIELTYLSIYQAIYYITTNEVELQFEARVRSLYAPGAELPWYDTYRIPQVAILLTNEPVRLLREPLARLQEWAIQSLGEPEWLEGAVD